MINISFNGICAINNKSYPSIGYGTSHLHDHVSMHLVKCALQIGYRVIDTASSYNNFISLGKILKKEVRDDIYLTSKVWPDHQTSEKLTNDLFLCLKQLQTDYLDAYLLHWPNSKILIEETLNTMVNLKNTGLIRHLGMSNVSVNHLKRIAHLCHNLSWIQVEMNPFFCDFELLEFCQHNNLNIQAWGSLARGKVFQDDMLKEVGKKHNKTAGQIAIKWIIQLGCLPLLSSRNIFHLLENFVLNDFTLSVDEIEAINNKAKNGQRTRLTQERNLGFTDEFDLSIEQCWPSL